MTKIFKNFDDGLFRIFDIFFSFEKLEHKMFGVYFCFECESFEMFFYKYKLSIVW